MTEVDSCPENIWRIWIPFVFQKECLWVNFTWMVGQQIKQRDGRLSSSNFGNTWRFGEWRRDGVWDRRGTSVGCEIYLPKQQFSPGALMSVTWRSDAIPGDPPPMSGSWQLKCGAWVGRILQRKQQYVMSRVSLQMIVLFDGPVQVRSTGLGSIASHTAWYSPIPITLSPFLPTPRSGFCNVLLTLARCIEDQKTLQGH